MTRHLFTSCEGSLFDTRMPNWAAHPLRTDYNRTHGTIDNTVQLRSTLRAGQWAWPGGYPMYFITDDGAALSFDAVRDNYAQCSRSIRERCSDGWRIVACAVNWEDGELTCDHTGKPIESAYAD